MLSASVCLFSSNDKVDPCKIAIAAEQRAFDALFVPENTHMPVTQRRGTPYPPDRMRALSSLHDPFVCLGACAAVTHRIRLGISVCLLTHRDAIATAKSVSSLDALSNGRVILGVAGGRIAEAMENHGAVFKERWRIVHEKTLAMRTMWRDEAPEFHGDYVDFGPLKQRIATIQHGGPPIWIGSNHKSVTSKIAQYADGWFVFNDRYKGEPLVDLKIACDQNERNVEDITVALMDAPKSAPELAAQYERGLRHFVFMLDGDSTTEIERDLDRLVNVVENIQV